MEIWKIVLIALGIYIVFAGSLLWVICLNSGIDSRAEEDNYGRQG